jgi:hypothetical protein
LETKSSFFSLVSPSTSWPISGLNSVLISSIVAAVSSTVSCSTAATMVASSRRRSVRIAATSSGWAKNRSPEARICVPCAFIA